MTSTNTDEMTAHHDNTPITKHAQGAGAAVLWIGHDEGQDGKQGCLPSVCVSGDGFKARVAEWPCAAKSAAPKFLGPIIPLHITPPPDAVGKAAGLRGNNN
ncbi:MAG: hypothetical protein FWF96_00675 [Kiritimatiellaeota bacterium]|nr:hypothetical protein [Kiritimatiellota bacterium]